MLLTNCFGSALSPPCLPPQGVNVWALVAAIVLLSSSVSDIQQLLFCLRRPSSTVTVPDVTETLYCIAVLLYAMREKGISISNRYGPRASSPPTAPWVLGETRVRWCQQASTLQGQEALFSHAASWGRVRTHGCVLFPREHVPVSLAPAARPLSQNMLSRY